MLQNNEKFSIFPTGYWNFTQQKAVPNQKPKQTQTIGWVGEYITSERARWATQELRKMASTATREKKQEFKALNFEYATFSGIFSYRNARSLVERTPFLTLDIDDLGSTEEAREVQRLLCADTNIETALCFVSPKGLGVKWIVRLPKWTEGLNFRDQFERMRRYVGFNYGIDPDKSGSDVCRACYLPWDEQCYINPKYVLPTNNLIVNE